MISYWFTLQTEFIKGRKTFALWQAFLFPLSISILVALGMSGTQIHDPNPWIRYVHNFYNITSFFFPYFLVIIIGYYSHVENKSNTWKHLLTQPVPKLSLYLGKLSMILVLVVLSYLFLILLGYLSSWIMHLLHPVKFHYKEGYFSFVSLSKKLLKVYLSGFLIIAVQYWISLRFKNLIVPFIIGTGLIILPIAVLIIMGMAGMLDQPKSLENVFKFDPYSYPFAHIFNLMKGPDPNLVVMPRLSIFYLGLSVIVSFLGYLDFRKRNF